jgi:uridylate kinase
VAYRSVLLKLSGEALGDEGHGLHRPAIDLISKQIAEVARTGVRLAIVVGGGNILRGRDVADTVTVRATADQMGMLATMINGPGSWTASSAGARRLMSAVPRTRSAAFIRRRAIRHQRRAACRARWRPGQPLLHHGTTAALRA